jgi:hypothetical protein
MTKRATTCGLSGTHDRHIWRQPVSIYTDDGGPTTVSVELICPGLIEARVESLDDQAVIEE